MAQAQNKIDRMVISVDLSCGKITKVVGAASTYIDPILNNKDRVVVNKPMDCNATYDRVWKNDTLKFVGSIFWTHSSPGCGWVLQDGWYQWVCDH